MNTVSKENLSSLVGGNNPSLLDELIRAKRTSNIKAPTSSVYVARFLPKEKGSLKGRVSLNRINL